MLEKALANYVVALDDAAATSREPDDKSLYEKYRAHGGLMLALAVSATDKARLAEEIAAHENLWVHSLLTDDAYQGPAEAWRAVASAWRDITANP